MLIDNSYNNSDLPIYDNGIIYSIDRVLLMAP